MDDGIEIVGGVNDPGDTAENENEKAAEEIGKQPVLGAKIRKFTLPTR